MELFLEMVSLRNLAMTQLFDPSMGVTLFVGLWCLSPSTCCSSRAAAHVPHVGQGEGGRLGRLVFRCSWVRNQGYAFLHFPLQY